MVKQTPEYFAAIHLGSEQVSMQIVEYTCLQDMKVIDQVSRRVDLGEEMFQTHKISFGTLNQVCNLLKGYWRLLKDYGVKDYRLVATTAVREATNQNYIIDQIKVKTGLRVSVVDMPQEIFYKYVSSYHNLAEQGLTADKEGILFVDISSGGLGMTLLQEETIRFQQNLHIGALRIKEGFELAQRESAHFHQALEEYIYSAVEPVKNYLENCRIRYLSLSGIETGLLLKMLHKVRRGNQFCVISVDEFNVLYEQVNRLNVPQLMQIFDLTIDMAEMVLPTLVLYHQMLSLTHVQEIVIPCDNFKDGITLLHLAEQKRDPWIKGIENQIFSLVWNLSKRYLSDTKHARMVEKLSLLLFDKMKKLHGLDKRERFLLQGAAILHEIGKFVSLRRHYYHSYQLIVSSDIMGFSDREKAIMANVAYYHTKGIPHSGQANYAELLEEDKVTVAKLAAMIRLADAMDRSHRNKVKKVNISLKGNELFIKVAVHEDYSLEEWTFASKADFFEDVFGVRALLERGKSNV